MSEITEAERKREILILRVDEQTKSELFEVARRTNRSASEIVREAVRIYAPGVDHAAKQKT